METELVIDNRTASDGSFFLFDKSVDYYISTFGCLLSNSHLFTNAPLKTIEQILDFIKSNPDLKYLSLRTIAEHSKLTTTSLGKRLKPLREHGVIIKKPFKFKDGTYHPKVTCEILRFDALNNKTKGQLTSAVEVEEIFEEPRANPRSRNIAVINQRKSDKNRIQKYGLQNLPSIDKDNLPQVVSLQSNFLPNQLAATEPRPRGAKALALREKRIYSEASRHLRITNHDGETVNFIARIRSYTGIMDPSDLQVLYAIYALTRYYHLTNSRVAGSLPERLTPINVHHVAALIGRARSGPNADYVRDCIQTIQDTEYNLSSLQSTVIMLDNSLKETYARDNFKNFEKCIPLTDEPDSIDDDGRIRLAKATIYLVALPEHLFNRLIQDDTLFAFPRDSLRVHPILFSLYLRLRATCYNNHFNERLQTTHQGISATQTYANFKLMLRTALKGITKSKVDHLYAKQQSKDVYLFSLFGFNGEVSFERDFIDGICDLDVMLACCEVERREGAERKYDTPTIFNELTLDYRDIVEKSSTRYISTILESKKLFYMIRYTVLNATHPILISKFYDMDAIREIVDWMVSVSGNVYEKELILERISRDLGELDGLTIMRQGQLVKLTEDEVQKLIEYISVTPIITDMSKFMTSLSRRRSLHGTLDKLLASDGDFEQLSQTEQSMIDSLLDDCAEELGYIDRCSHLSL